MAHSKIAQRIVHFKATVAATLFITCQIANAGCENEKITRDAILCLEKKIASSATKNELLRIPKGAVVPFESNECPAGWSEYISAQGRFIRGIDKQGAIDPDGRRAPGSLQADQFAQHRHERPQDVYDAGGGDNAAWVKNAHELGYGHSNPPSTGPAGKGNETRPKNVALLYCQKQ